MKKIISLLTSLSIVFGVLGTFTVFAEEPAAETITLSVGDYVQMGTYYDAPILWRCVAFERIKGYESDGTPITDSTDTVTEYREGYLPLMLSDKIICCKAFDAMTNVNSEVGFNSETGSHSRRKRPTTTESNYWADSNIRSWLNSTASAGNVIWACGNPPHQDDWNNVLWGGYENEAGFLTNFSEDERSIIKEVSQKSIVAGSDKDLDGVTGSALHKYEFGMSEIVQNYDEAYSEQVKDTIFLPDVKQIDTVYKNGATLGADYFIPYPTEEAAEIARSFGVTTIGGVEQWSYMLRTPYCTDSNKNDTDIRKVCNANGGYVGSFSASFGSNGVRPAFFLDLSKAVFESGDGTENSPYIATSRSVDEVMEISTLEELEAFRDNVNAGNTYEGKTVKLTADIDMSEKYGEGKESWTPIGIDDWNTDTHNLFLGTFDGGNHTISGLYINTDEAYVALFCSIEGTLKNLNVKGLVSTTSLDGQAAGITFFNNGSIINCTFDGTIESPHYSAAGIANGNGGVIENCKVSGKIIGEHNVGGISGYSLGEFINCINEAEITGWAPVGGIASSGSECKIKNCINKGSVTGRKYEDLRTDENGDEFTYIMESFSIGGIIGETSIESTIENCYNTGDISGNSEVGGIIGNVLTYYTDSSVLLQVKNCYNTGKITSTMENDGEHNIGAIIGSSEYNYTCDGENFTKVLSSEAVNCYYLVGTADKGCGGNADDTATVFTAEQFKDKSNFTNWDFDTVWEMDETLGRPVLRSNRESVDEIIEISTLAELEAFRDDVNGGNTYEGKIVKLTADIDMSEKYGEGKESWTPIAISDWETSNTFSGTFDGCGHKITNLYINDTGNGLFGFVAGIVKNLGVEADIYATFEKVEVVGGIAAELSGTIENCFFSGSIEGDSHIGGIVGGNQMGQVINCYNTGTIKGLHCIGGIVGTGGGATNCYNVGSIIRIEAEWDSPFFGSITGCAYEDVVNCYYLEGTYDIGAYVEEGTGGADTATALTLEQLADKTNFANWDFETVWEMDANLGRPVLRSNREDPSVHTHTLVHHADVPATCTENGTGEYWKCEGADACNKMFSDSNATGEITEIPVISATGHNWGAWSITTEPTFDTTGIAERICGNDNTHKETVDLPVLSDRDVWEESLRKEPTEIFDGFCMYISQYGSVSVTIHALTDKHFLIEYADGTAMVQSRDTGTYAVIFAAYDKNGVLTSLEFKPVTFETAGIQKVEAENFTENDTVRVMLWESLESMKPLCAADGN